MSPPEHSRRLRKMLQQIAPGSEVGKLAESLESSRPSDGESVESLDAGRPQRDEEGFALEALDHLLRNGLESPLDDEQQESLEAIVLPRLRPVVDIIGGKIQVANLTQTWRHLGTGEARQRIERAIPCVGRVEVPNHPRLPYAGTGFVVGTDLLMTNRHVAEIFASGLGLRELSFRPGQTAGIDFKQEVQPTEPELLTVLSVLMIHPYWDMSLLRVSGLPAGHPVLKVSVVNVSEMRDRDIVVIGYPAQDWRNDLDLQNRIFRGIYNVKRMQPGKLKDRRDILSFGNTVNAVTHDSSTLGGNSGSAVLDVATGEVVGLHFAGEYLDANFAVPAFSLAEDSRVVDAGVNFAGRVEPRRDFYGPVWLEADAEAVTNGAPRAEVGGAGRPPAAAAAPWMSVSSSSASWTIPIQVSISVGTPAPSAPAVTVDRGAAVMPVEGTLFRRERDAARQSFARFSADSLVATEFAWPTALSLALASSLAYESSESIESTALTMWQLRSCEFIEADDTQCFVASSDHARLVAFRGTESVGDWLADLNVLSTDRPYGTVHRGFCSAFAVVDSQLRAALSRQGDKPLLITGHSLGGALAMIAAAEWQGVYPISWVYTYGQPCVGRGNFVAFMAQNYRDKLVRFVNDDDIVPRVPPRYSHVGKLIHFDASGNVQAATETLTAMDRPTMTEAEFDDLRAWLLAERARRRAVGAGESLAGAGVEGLVPSFRDHSLERYVSKIAAKTPL